VALVVIVFTLVRAASRRAGGFAILVALLDTLGLPLWPVEHLKGDLFRIVRTVHLAVAFGKADVRSWVLTSFAGTITCSGSKRARSSMCASGWLLAGGGWM